MNSDYKINRQKSGFQSKTAAMEYRDALIVQLSNREYIPYRFTLKEFYDYWLYYVLIDINHVAYNTFNGYKTPVNRLLEFLGPDTYMDTITLTNLKQFIATLTNASARKTTYTMLKKIFSIRKRELHHLI